MRRTEQTDLFDEFLDDVYPSVDIIGGGFLPYSEVLKSCDPIAYRCAFLDWLDSEDEEEEEDA